MSKNKNQLQKGSAKLLGVHVRSAFVVFTNTKSIIFYVFCFSTNKKVSNYFPKSLTLAKGKAAWSARERSHRQSGRVGQRRRDTGDGNIDIILKKRQ